MATFPQLPKLYIGPMHRGDRTFILAEYLKHARGIVPAGFRTDGASIPRIFWPVFSPTGITFPSSIVHDHDYQTSEGTRKETDLAFLANMKKTGVGWFARHTIYRAVRIGAGRTWRTRRK